MQTLDGKKLIFWGTGSLSKKIYNDLLMREIEVDVTCFIDNDIKKAGYEILGTPIFYASDINKVKTGQHVIVICSSYEESISQQLMSLGFERSVDFITYYDFNKYIAYLTASSQVAFNDELKVIVGAAQTSQVGWISTNQSFLDMLHKEDWIRLFGTRKIQSIVAEHVWEHLTYEDGVNCARNCFEQLAEGGRLRIAIPDGNHPNSYYINWVKPGGFGGGADDHKELYTHQTLDQMLRDAGFTKIEKLEYFDGEGNFHNSEWNEEDGNIRRSIENDPRNWRGDIVYSSLIMDAIK